MIKALLNSAGRLTDKQIISYITNHDVKKYQENEKYFTGENPTIANWNEKDDINYDSYVASPTQREDIAPNNKIAVPYGRKISLTTKNYMFAKPIVYYAENKDYVSSLNDVFFLNSNEKKVNDIGLDLIVHGVSYKLFYHEVRANKTVPFYSVIDQDQMIPIYSYDIEPRLIVAIRHYKQINADGKEIHKAEIYYETAMVRAEVQGENLIQQTETSYEWGRVPVVVYGDEYQLGVFDSVKKIIDAVDVVISADVNEVQRFEMLYMILVGDKLPEDDKEVQKMVRRRIFELSKEAQMSYLERHVDGEFNMSVLDRLEKLIHKMSGVPDFEGPEFAAESGIALLYKLMGFENIAMQYEAAFKQGELESIDLINSMLVNAKDKYVFWDQNRDKQVEIKMFRNLPEDVTARLAEAVQMKNLGISMETILDNLPMIKDTQAELERMGKQAEENFTKYQKMMEKQPTEEPEEEQPEQPEELAQ